MHTETLRVLAGSISLTLNAADAHPRWHTYTARDGALTVPRGVAHEWKPAAGGSTDVIVEESTDPADGLKEVFFRNLNSVLLEPEPATPKGFS
ncbi:MAG: 3'-phosphoadenosine 5'-phosphosulfate sulfotransferase, partial [Chaenotheca gracillima]